MAQFPTFKVGNYGQTIRRTIVDEKNDPVDISAVVPASSDIVFKFHDPDGNLTSVDGAFTNTGTDGQVEYVLLSTDTTIFDEEGTWTLQITVTESAGSTFNISTSQEELTVSPVLT